MSGGLRLCAKGFHRWVTRHPEGKPFERYCSRCGQVWKP